MSLRQTIDQDSARIRAIRHDLHAHPELMYEEVRTSDLVQRELAAANIQFKSGLAKGTGVLGYLPATEPGGRTVALRADMDALPIHEETGLSYASQTPGKMHACGHDGHTSILIGVSRALAKQETRRNNVLLVFQPAEEGGAGGDAMCQEGVLDGIHFPAKADVIYGLHGWPDNEVGLFATRNGPMMAATNDFIVTLTGRGGHAASPHNGADPVVAAAQVVTALQTIISRNANPLDSLVFTVGAIHAGKANNVIPETCEMIGTMRTLLPGTREMGKRRFFEVVEGVAGAMGCKVHIHWHEGYPVTANDPWAADRFRSIAKSVLGEARVAELENPVMGGEDFSYYGLRIPACFFFVGLRPADQSRIPLVHTPHFNFNDDVIPDCIETFCRLALDPV